MVSVVCVYNDETLLNNTLLKSLEKQTANHETILLNNSLGTYGSAAEALNFGGRKAKGEFLLFVHQDVDFFSCDWLEKATAYLRALPDVGIAGIAGKSNKKATITNIKHGNPPILAGGIQIEKPTKVQTLDECLIIIPKTVFNTLEFDEKTCIDWHLYAVDYCLSLEKYLYSVYVLPLFIHHISTGHSISEKYFSSLKNVIKKHRKEHKVIFTTIHNWDANRPLILQRVQRKYKLLEEKFLVIVLRFLDFLGIKNQLKSSINFFIPKRKKGPF